MKKIILILFLHTLSLQLFAQQDKFYGKLRGKILDASTKSPLIAANILIQETELGAASDESGQFIVENVPAGIYSVRLMMMGYTTRIISNVVMNPNKTTWLNVEMESTVLEAEGVTVTAGYFHEAKDAVVSNRSVDFEEIRMDPGSAEDIQRVMQVLPAVVSGSDQENEIIVRGGMPGENLFLMDHIEIPNPNHFGYQGAGGGPINMINTHFVRQVDFYAGAFPARYGDKASSVMDISLRDGNRESVAGHAYLGMSGVGAMIEGPIARGKGSYILGGSKSFLDLIISSTGLTAVPQYYSFQGKMTYDLDPSNQLLINGIYGNDHIDIEDEEDGYGRGAENVKSKSHQYAYGMTWRHLIGSRGYSLVTLSQATNYWNQFVYHNDGTPYYTNQSTETERTLKGELTYQLSKKFEVNTGGQLKSVLFDIGQWAGQDTIFIYNYPQNPTQIIGIYQLYDVFDRQSDDHSYKAAGFFHLKINPLPKLTATLGLRTDYFDYTGKQAWDPRIGLSYAVKENTNLNLAVGRHSQAPAYIQLSAHPLNKDLDYKETEQIVFGFEHLFREDMRGTLEFYYKDYHNVPIATSMLSKDPFDASYGRMVNEGEGYAKGVEVFLQKKRVKNLHFTLSYSYSISKAYDPRYDVSYNWDYDYRHVFTFVTGMRWDLRSKLWYQNLQSSLLYNIFEWALPFGDQVEVGIRWRYMGGRPYTDQIYYPQYRLWLVDETVQLNGKRYPEYHRLDFRLDRRFMFRGWNMVTYLDIMNVYARDNIWMYAYNDDGTKEDVLQFQVFPVGG